MSRRLLTVLGALAAVSLLVPSLAGARRKPRFPACPGGVFVVVVKALLIVVVAEVLLRASRRPGCRLWIPRRGT